MAKYRTAKDRVVWSGGGDDQDISRRWHAGERFTTLKGLFLNKAQAERLGIDTVFFAEQIWTPWQGKKHTICAHSLQVVRRPDDAGAWLEELNDTAR